MASAESVAAVIEAGGAHVPELMERLEARLQELARSHGAVLAEHAGATIAAGGKRLRPLLVFVAAGAERDDDAVLRAAVAVELVHSATLVHDDVLDAAPLRRGRPTVVATAGRAMATATGDLLFSRAFAELAAGGSADAVRVLSDASSALAQGELLQREDAWNTAIDARALPGALRPQDRAAVRGGAAGWARRPAAAPRTSSGASAATSASRSSCSTTCSTCQARPSAPASTAAPTCSTARSRCR